MLTDCHGADGVGDVVRWDEGLDDREASYDVTAGPSSDEDVIAVDFSTGCTLINGI